MRYFPLGAVALACVISGDPAAAQGCNPDVDATAPGGRFQLNGDGTATDTGTGLTWQRCPLGYTLSGSGCTAAGGATTFDWQGALRAAEQNDSAGANDWRVPNVTELLSIVEYRCYRPAIDRGVFPDNDLATESFWTSTPLGHDRLSVAVDFSDGGGSLFDRGAVRLPVRLVR